MAGVATRSQHAGDADWKREGAGSKTLERVNWITLGFDSWGAPPPTIWVDGIGLL
jgi:hypothetical protein